MKNCKIRSSLIQVLSSLFSIDIYFLKIGQKSVYDEAMYLISACGFNLHKVVPWKYNGCTHVGWLGSNTKQGDTMMYQKRNINMKQNAKKTHTKEKGLEQI